MHNTSYNIELLISKRAILFSRCLSGKSCKSYDLQFDHSIPVYSLEQMISIGKFQYDYPVYWKKPEDISKSTSTLSRKNKKEKMLKDLSETCVKLFNSILKNPRDFSLCMFFCESRLKLVCYIAMIMISNYESRFLHSEKIFQKYERTLFCLDFINIDKFDQNLQRYDLLCKDYNNFFDRFSNAFYLIVKDLNNYSLLTGKKLSSDNKYTTLLNKSKFHEKINASKVYINKIVLKLLKERDKRKSAAEDQKKDSLFLLDNTVSLPSTSTEGADNLRPPSDTAGLNADNLKQPSDTTGLNADNLKQPSDTTGLNADNLKPPMQSKHVYLPEIAEGRKAHPPNYLLSNLTQPLLSNLHLTSYLHNLFNSFFNVSNIPFFSLPLLLVPIGMRFSTYFNVDYKEIITLWSNSLILPSFVAAIAITYALNYRNMPKPMVKILLQVLITSILISVLFHYFSNPISSEIPEKNELPSANPTDKINPPANPTDKINLPPTDPALPTDPAAGSDGPLDQPWYYSKKVWGCLIAVGLAAFIYYLKGFAPGSPDDMNSFTTAVSQGIDRVSSEQVSLGQTVAERVNSAAFRAELQNRTLEELLSDIASAGDVARLQLEQMTGVAQDLIQLHSRVENINDRMTVLLKGIIYLISLKWVFLNPNNERVSGSEVVNEVLSLERPFSFDSARSIQNLTTVEISTQTDEAVVDVAQTEAAATVEISTHTNGLFMDRAYTVLQPAISSIGETSHRLIDRIGGSLSSSDDDEDGVGYVSAKTSTQELPTGTGTGTGTELPSTSTNQSSADYTHDFLRVLDNPTYQPTSSLDTGSASLPHPVDDENPYQLHRNRLYNVKRVFLYLCQLLEQM